MSEASSTSAAARAGQDIDPQDAKLLVLARAARARTGTDEGAAVRDLDGRTYAAAGVALASLQLSALQAAVAAAVASGVTRLAAAAVVSSAATIDGPGLSAVRDLSRAAAVFLAAVDGTLLGVDRGEGGWQEWTTK